MENLGCVDEEYAGKLVDWADLIRKTFYDGGVDEIIATRRLVHIVHAFAIFKDRMKAIAMCVARFDDQTKEVFMDLYSKLDEKVSVEENSDSEKSEWEAERPKKFLGNRLIYREWEKSHSLFLWLKWSYYGRHQSTS